MKQCRWLFAFLLAAAFLCLAASAETIFVSTKDELTSAATALAESGGTISLAADFSITNTTMPQTSAKITLDGGGHTLTLTGNLALSGDYDIKNITFCNSGTYRSITCGGHEVHFYDTVNCTKTGSYYPSIMAGFTTAQSFSWGRVVIDGGTWQRVRGGNANSNAGAFVQTCDISITGGIFNEVFQVAGGGNIPSGSRFSAIISGGLFKSGITLYNATGSVNAHTALSIYGGDIDGEISVGGDAAVIDGDVNLWLYDGDFADCTAISGYNGTGDVNVKVKIEEKLASHVYPSTSVSTLPSSLLRTGAADPCLFTFGDTYYLTMTGTSNIALLKSKDISALASLTLSPNIVYRGAQDSNAIDNLGYTELSGTWSPEIHYFTQEEFGQNAGWYMYLALRKKTGDSSDISMVALRSANGITPDGPYVHPTSGETYVSQTILDKNGKPFNEEWGCGMSILRIESGEYAGVYAMWVGEENRGTPAFRQMIWIAKLQSPWQLAGDPAVIMYPTQAWEKLCKGYTNGTYYPEVVEGTTAVYGKDGQIYVVYSGGGYWWTYGIGQMTWNGGDPLSASSWVKYENNPTFACNTANGTHYNGLYLQGAGHATYFTDANGQMYTAYHAYPSDANGDKGENPSRNAYLEPCYIDYSLNNGVNQGVLLVGSGDGKPANPDEAPAVTVTLEGEGTTVLDLCDENAAPVVFVKLEPPLVTATNQADGSILLTMEDHNPAGTTYRILRSVGGGHSYAYPPVAVVSEKQYIDRDVTVGTKYSYLVEPFNENYSTSGWTAAPVTALPAVPVISAKKLTDGGEGISLALDASAPAGATLRAAYRIADGEFTAMSDPTALSDLSRGAWYTVRMESVVNVGGVDYVSAPVEFEFQADLPTLAFSDVSASGFTADFTLPQGATSLVYTCGETAVPLADGNSGNRTEISLTPYTDYTVKIAADVGDIAVETVRTVKTLCAHAWDGGTETLPATYTAAGVLTYTCTVCGETRTEEIPMLVSETYYSEIVYGAQYDAIAARAAGANFVLSSFVKRGYPEGTAVLSLAQEFSESGEYFVYKLVGDFMLATAYSAEGGGLVIDGEDGDVYAVANRALVLYGDTNTDGKLSLSDVLRTMRYLADNTVEADVAAADFNGTASVTLLDCLGILLAVLNK